MKLRFVSVLTLIFLLAACTSDTGNEKKSELLKASMPDQAFLMPFDLYYLQARNAKPQEITYAQNSIAAQFALLGGLEYEKQGTEYSWHVNKEYTVVGSRFENIPLEGSSWDLVHVKADVQASEYARAQDRYTLEISLSELLASAKSGIIELEPIILKKAVPFIKKDSGIMYVREIAWMPEDQYFLVVITLG